MDVIGSLEVRWIQGFTNSTIEFVDNNTICYTCGNHICFLNLKTESKSLLQGPGRGIGAFTARGTSGIFAFSEQKLSPSIFVYAFPELHMKNELKGKEQMDYTSLALSDGAPYLGCCSSLPDQTITVWNWETAEPVCTQPQAGKDVISLVFNPMNWLQLCALGTASITVWNIEESASLHVLKPCVVQLPATDGFLAERLGPTSSNVKPPNFSPEIPPSTISRLTGNNAETDTTKLTSGARLTPSAICWTTTSDLFVGCAEGFLFLVNPENLSVTVLFNPTTPDVAPDLADLRQSSFQGLTLNKNGVIAVGKDSVVHCLQIKGTQIDITQTWQIEGTATNAIYSPDYETLLISSNTGQIYMLNSTTSDKIEKVLDVLSGNFVAAAWSHSDKNICVSVRDSGELQMQTVDGMCHGSLPLQAEVTSMAYCPIAQYAAIGTTTGNVLFVDLNREQEPRLVHQVQLYHSRVDHLVFDQEGHCLLTGASDSNIYVIDVKPSKKFPIIGYTVVPGPILSLSTQCVRDGEQVKVLALCARQEGDKHDSSLLTLPLQALKDLTGPDCVDQHGCLSPHVLKLSRNEVSHPPESCVLGVSKICHRKKTLQQFQLPEVSSGAETVAVLEQDESSNILLSAPPSHPTWLEGRQDAVMEEENQKYSETKENLRKTIEELRDTIQEMMCENETLPAIEHLEQQEFNLNVKEQRRQAAIVEQEVTRVRNEIEWEILEKCYLRDVLKRACWDSLKVKGRAIKGFHSEHEVKNYPLEERSEKEVEELRRVENIRKIEMAACTQCDLKKCSNTSSPKEEEQGEEDHTAENAAVTGSFSAQLGYSNPYIYNQLSLKTTERRINQVILLQDVIYRIKMAFNTEFEALHRQKVQELNHVRDRNRLISEILLELDMKQQLWEPSLTDSEWPERLLTVDDSEIKAEKYLTLEQSKEEGKKKLEEQRRLAAKEDDCRERALDDMMDGVLEARKENILKMEIPPPEFVLTKPDIHWTEEEKKVYKQYEKKTKELSERKEKHRKLLETEMKKLQTSTRDATKRFDETLTKLLEKKIKCDMAIYQEKLKIAHLVCAVLLEEEMRNRELELKLELEKLLAHKDELEEKVKSREEDVELFHKAYDTVVAEDKVLDKEFRKEFCDVPALIVDHLYKLFRRRPRVQKLRTQTDNNPNPFKDQHLCSSQTSDTLDKMLKAMEELDAPENIPKGLNPSIWERFCLFRRSKIESEQKVKVKALALAEMQALLQKRRDETEAVEQEIKNLSDQCESLHKEKNSSLMDIMVQIVLKQSQVSTADVTAEDSDFELLHRSVVEELNKTIRMLGEQKISSMVECKDFRKGTIELEWEHKVIAAQIEDLNNKARDIQTMRLSEEQRDYLTKTTRAGSTSKQVSIVEKTIDLQKEIHQHKVQKCMKEIEQLNKQAAMKAQSNKIIEQQLPDMQVTVAERGHINEAAEENQEPTTEESYLEIPQKKHLKDYARAQEEHLVVLRAELERLRMRTFPSLDELKH